MKAPTKAENQGSLPKWFYFVHPKALDPALSFKSGEGKTDACLALAARIQAISFRFLGFAGCLALSLAAIMRNHPWSATLTAITVLLAGGFVWAVTVIMEFWFLSRCLPAASRIVHAGGPQESENRRAVSIEWPGEQGEMEAYKMHLHFDQMRFAELVSDVGDCLDGRVKKSHYGRSWLMQDMASGRILEEGLKDKTLKDLGISPGTTIRVQFCQPAQHEPAN